MTPCEAESKGGLCVYRAGHEGPHRYEGGDEAGRYQDALERFRQEKESRVKDMEPPRNVRIQHRDGTTTPCELVYLGEDEEGVHQWEAVTPVRVKHGDRVRADQIPGRTAITVKVRAKGQSIALSPDPPQDSKDA